MDDSSVFYWDITKCEWDYLGPQYFSVGGSQYNRIVFNPFTNETLFSVTSQLETVASKKKITLVALGEPNIKLFSYLAQRSWLNQNYSYVEQVPDMYSTDKWVVKVFGS